MSIQLSENEKLTKQAYDNQAVSWEAEHSSENFWESELETFRKLLPKGRILEIGAGAGRDAEELAKIGYEYYGTDISGGLLDAARRKNPDLKFDEISVYDLDFDAEFNGFWCSAVLLHIPRDRISDALQPMRKAVKTGGIGFIAIKEGDGDDLETWKNTDEKRLFVYWNDADFRDVLLQNNFEVVDSAYRPMSERTKWLIYFVKAV